MLVLTPPLVMQTVYACGVSGEPLPVNFALLGTNCQLAAVLEHLTPLIPFPADHCASDGQIVAVTS